MLSLLVIKTYLSGIYRFWVIRNEIPLSNVLVEPMLPIGRAWVGPMWNHNLVAMASSDSLYVRVMMTYMEHKFWAIRIRYSSLMLSLLVIKTYLSEYIGFG